MTALTINFTVNFANIKHPNINLTKDSDSDTNDKQYKEHNNDSLYDATTDYDSDTDYDADTDTETYAHPDLDNDIESNVMTNDSNKTITHVHTDSDETQLPYSNLTNTDQTQTYDFDETQFFNNDTIPKPSKHLHIRRKTTLTHNIDDDTTDDIDSPS